MQQLKLPFLYHAVNVPFRSTFNAHCEEKLLCKYIDLDPQLI